MRVTINYSVDTEKIPTEIRKLCREAFELTVDVSDLEEDWTESLDAEGYEKAYKVLHHARANLLAIDARFADCQGILLDYQKILISKRTEEVEAAQAEQMNLDFPPEEPVVYAMEGATDESPEEPIAYMMEGAADE